MTSDLSAAFQALSSPSRLVLMERLLQQALSCEEADRPAECGLDPTCCGFGDLAGELDLSKSTVSRHLKELERAGLVERIREGRRVFIRVDVDRLEELRVFLDARNHQFEDSIAQ